MVYCFSLDVTGTTNIAFLFDGSENVPTAEFNVMKQFVRAAITGYTISPRATKVSLATYGSSFKLNSNFLSDRQSLFYALSTANPIGGKQAPGKAVRLAQTTIFNQLPLNDKGGRILVMFIAGRNDLHQTALLQQQLPILKQKEIELVIVAIGNNVLIPRLRSFVSRLSNLIVIRDFYLLPEFIHQVILLSLPPSGK